MFRNNIKAWALLMVAILATQASIAQEEALCAEVKIQIMQELTMERQGFEAIMRIDNSLDTFDLEDISVSVHFTDADGNPVVATSNTADSDADFFIRVDDTQDVSSLNEGADGLVEQGRIAPNRTGVIRWLIVPTGNAAGQLQEGKLYQVGAHLEYSYGGKEEEVEVAPDSIVVKPQPALTLDYFLTREVIGDDAFTDEVEPPEPYTLGVRIANNGYGVARSVNIESAQPTIVENDLGLAVDFSILGSFLGGEPAEPDLTIDFGDIQPGSVSSGRWIMETSLSGEFTDFTANFTHADELGGELTSLLEATNTHFLKQDVLVDLSGRDNVRDFLAYAPTGELYVYESEATGLEQTYCDHCARVEELSANLSGDSELTHDAESGFSYARVTDPYGGSRVLDRVVRSDGKVMHPQNAWLSKERADNDVDFNYYINVFDNQSTGEYSLHWGDSVSDQPQPPVVRAVPDQVTYEGGQLGFLVQASDPNGDRPVLSVDSLPTGADFVDQGDGTGRLEWLPVRGQAGAYQLTFTASDAELETEQSATILVHPYYDTDGDGMDDDWEREHFGDLSRDGTGDYSGDGRTDLQAFREGLDPTASVTLPGVPQIESPIFDAAILQGASAPYYPQLVVTNANHSDGIESVEVLFEVYADEALTEPVARARVAEGEGETTAVQLDSSHLLQDASFEDKTLNYWRARAIDSADETRTSGWVKSRFFIDAEPVEPTPPGISRPAVEAVVDELQPTLAVTNSQIEDRSRLYYEFALYTEQDPSEPVARAGGLAPGVEGETRWPVPVELENHGRYLWQVTVESSNGSSATSEWGSFLVSTENAAPSEPAVAAPADGAELSAEEVASGLTLVVDNGEDPEGMPVSYVFELDRVETFDSEHKRESPSLTEGQGQTSWTLDDLTLGQSYFWRVRASDGELDSDWVRASFSVAAAPEPPVAPVLQNPVDGALVQSLTPAMEINPVEHEESLQYRFELYAEAGGEGFVAEQSGSALHWTPDFDLTDGETYHWRARAEAGEDLVGAWSDWANFEVSDPAANQPPELSFVLPDQSVEVDPASDGPVSLQWVDQVPSGEAQIELFYLDESDTQHTIASSIDAVPDGETDQYAWDLAGVAPGTYRVAAEIVDEQHTVTAEACCDIVVLENQCEPEATGWVSANETIVYDHGNPLRDRRRPDARVEGTITNVSDESLTGPVRLVLRNLTETVSLANADGEDQGDSYLVVLEEGQVLSSGETSGVFTLEIAGGGQSLFNFDDDFQQYQADDGCP